MSDPMNMGKSLSIPTVLISKENGEKLKIFYRDNKDNRDVLKSIKLEIDFEVGKKDDIVEYEYFYSGGNQEVYKNLSELQDLNAMLGNLIHYKSRYITTSSDNFRLAEYKDSDMCMVKGKYCPLYNNGFTSGTTFSGVDYINSHIKERCLQDIINNKKLNRNSFWAYISKVNQTCLAETAKKFDSLNDCINEVITDLLGAGIKEDVATCFMSSFIPDLHDGK
jgi:hypothetical protein